MAEVARYVGAHDFVDAADKTNSAATDALSPTATLVGQIIWQTSALALGFAYRDHLLNAMRVGLLTRFMGVLGVIVGVAVAADPAHRPAGHHPRVLAGRLGVLFLGRWPTASPRRGPPGEAEPWPTQQQLREQRDAARAESAAAAGDDEPEDSARERARRAGDPAAHGSEPAPSRSRRRRQRARASKKKKRKRRS